MLQRGVLNMNNIIVSEDDFDPGALVDDLRAVAPDAGGIASFIGVVRASAGASPGADAATTRVTALWLEHYPGMTERSIEAVVANAGTRWPLLATTVVHRVGRLEPGARIVAVVVASRHRGAAFDACRFIMDYLKTDAIFWKRECGADGSERWIEPTAEDRSRVAGWRAGGSSAG